MIRILTICILALLISCQTSSRLAQGEDFPLQRALYVTEGMNGSEVLQVMEQPPYDRLMGGQNNNKETWVWVFSEDGETKTFSVLFEDSKVAATNIFVK